MSNTKEDAHDDVDVRNPADAPALDANEKRDDEEGDKAEKQLVPAAVGAASQGGDVTQGPQVGQHAVLDTSSARLMYSQRGNPQGDFISYHPNTGTYGMTSTTVASGNQFVEASLRMIQPREDSMMSWTVNQVPRHIVDKIERAERSYYSQNESSVPGREELEEMHRQVEEFEESIADDIARDVELRIAAIRRTMTGATEPVPVAEPAQRAAPTIPAAPAPRHTARQQPNDHLEELRRQSRENALNIARTRSMLATMEVLALELEEALRAVGGQYRGGRGRVGFNAEDHIMELEALERAKECQDDERLENRGGQDRGGYRGGRSQYRGRYRAQGPYHRRNRRGRRSDRGSGQGFD
ncbi:hypothetical protein GGS20DRAFT_587441 [Poronia punctata]|nr:hypothetical protein GGS20DRAFT_587441 [Poronia punctata]